MVNQTSLSIYLEGLFLWGKAMEGLLGTQPQQAIPDQEVPQDQPEDQLQEQPEDQAAGQLSEKIEPHIMDGVENKEALDQVLEQGMKLLFSKETHDKLFSQIRPEDQIEIADELGTAATNIMLIMYQKSGNSIPPEVIIPAGTVLLARAVDYINEAGIAQVSDEQFGDALNIFVDVIQAKLDPEYEQRMKAGSEGMPQEGEPAQPDPSQPDPLTQGSLV